MSSRLYRPIIPSIAALVVAWGCTPTGPEPSSTERGGRSFGEISQQSELRPWEVIDRASRWKTSVPATQEPEVVTQAGYVHVRVQGKDARPVDCFLYDSPIITGQALVRLLNAAQIGIQYEGTQVEIVEPVANNPLILVRADFREEDGGRRGKLFVGLVPRVKIPVVCSHESTSSSVLHSTLRHLVEGLTPSSDYSFDSLAPGERLSVFEIWTLYRAGRPIGFRQWRAAEKESGELSTLEIASLLEPQGSRLRAIDVRIAEHADERGLRVSDWLELEDGEVRARAALERVPSASAPGEDEGGALSYRVAGIGPQGPVQTTVTAGEPFRSSYFSYQELARAQAAGGEAEFLSFLPNFEPTQATRVHYKPLALAEGSDGARGELRAGGSVYELKWEAGALVSRKDASSGLESRLALRLFGTDGS